MTTRTLQRHMPTASAMSGGAVNVRVLILNVLLMMAALGLLTYYVVQANAFAAFQYDIGAQDEQLMQLREKHHAASAHVAELEHSDRVSEYARSAGMVLASDASYVSIPDSPLAGR